MKVLVVPYDPAWPKRFEEEARAIRAILGEELTAIHHIGSTSVPGLMAKPILDIMPVVKAIHRVDGYDSAFEALGYQCMGEFGIPGRRYYRKGGENRTHQIHIFQQSDLENVRRHLAVRDYLRTHPQEAADYGALKRRLALAYPEDIDGYCDGKDAFVKALEQRALAWKAAQEGYKTPGN